jgi:hypothetical protein
MWGVATVIYQLQNYLELKTCIELNFGNQVTVLAAGKRERSDVYHKAIKRLGD